MNWTYCCPHCSAMLNPDRTIIVLAEREGARHLVGFHPQPGNYQVHLPADVAWVPGSQWDFFCPVCREPLTTELSADLCALDMLTGGVRHRVYFSRIAGEEATFVVSAEGLLANYGVHTDRYLEQLVHDLYRR